MAQNPKHLAQVCSRLSKMLLFMETQWGEHDLSDSGIQDTPFSQAVLGKLFH